MNFIISAMSIYAHGMLKLIITFVSNNIKSTFEYSWYLFYRSFLIGLFYLTVTFLINKWCRFLIRSDKYSSQTKEFIVSCYSTRDETGLDFWQPISIPVPALSLDSDKWCRQVSPKGNTIDWSTWNSYRYQFYLWTVLINTWKIKNAFISLTLSLISNIRGVW
jgi:hypothetical protein